jgi:hypothetical protein
MSSERGGERGAATVRLVIGLLVVALGALFLAENLGWAPAEQLQRRFWPAALAAIGVTLLLQPGRAPGRWWGAVWVAAGGWIFADQQGWVEVGFWQLFAPLAVLVVGAHLVWRALAGGRDVPARRPGEEPEAFIHSFAIMAGNELRSVSRVFRGADLGAFMGAVTLDLRDSRMEGEQAVIDALAIWGGIEIRIPADWGVTSSVLPLLGGFEDKTQPRGAEPVKRLLVRGIALMGGIEVKN